MVNQREIYHRILDVPRGTSLQGLRTAYKGLAKKWHPDKHPSASKPEAEARFKAITEAYEVSIGIGIDILLLALVAIVAMCSCC
ncbi:hypothetical protein ZWY2020_023178 [Hordeum vulgare]|nr:hypothetical protein ZWY2020_023178 [Hordeum vulgare]